MPECEREGTLQACQKIHKLGVFRIQYDQAAGIKEWLPIMGVLRIRSKRAEAV